MSTNKSDTEISSNMEMLIISFISTSMLLTIIGMYLCWRQLGMAMEYAL